MKNNMDAPISKKRRYRRHGKQNVLIIVGKSATRIYIGHYAIAGRLCPRKNARVRRRAVHQFYIKQNTPVQTNKQTNVQTTTHHGWTQHTCEKLVLNISTVFFPALSIFLLFLTNKSDHIGRRITSMANADYIHTYIFY